MPLHVPADPQQCTKNFASLRAWPHTHRCEKVMLEKLETLETLLVSNFSASTRNVSASTCARASARVFPYVITPGNSSTSASHLPFFSRSVSIVNFLFAIV